MKTLSILGMALTLAACASGSVNTAVETCPPPTRPVERDARVADVDASELPVAAAPAREPEALPAELASHTLPFDVDLDGRVDLVRDLSGVFAAAERHDSVVGVLVAHRLEDGRFAVDDDVTRAALRAMCPSPPATTAYTSAYAGPRVGARSLFFEGLCMRAWGSTTEAAEARMREIVAASRSGFFTPDAVDQVVTALRETPMAVTLRGMAPATHPTEAQTSAPTPRGARVSGDGPCRATLAVNERVVRVGRVGFGVFGMGEEMIEPRVDVRGTCAATSHGAWSIWLGSPRREQHVIVEVPAVLSWRSSVTGARPSRPFPIRVRGGSEAHEASIVASGDIDGDGIDEVLLRRTVRTFSGESSSQVAVYTARGGAVGAYAPATGIEHIIGATDFDGDGRLDLVLSDRPDHTSPFESPAVALPEFRMLAHALSDGTFSRSDEVSRRFAEAECSRGGGLAGALRSVVCARATGASRESLVANLAAASALPTTLTTFEDLGARVRFFRTAMAAVFGPPLGARAALSFGVHGPGPLEGLDGRSQQH